MQALKSLQLVNWLQKMLNMHNFRSDDVIIKRLSAMDCHMSWYKLALLNFSKAKCTTNAESVVNVIFTRII